MVRPIDRSTLFDALPDACLVLTADLVVADANRAYTTLLGRSVDELVGRRVGEVFAVNPADPAAAHRLTSAFRSVLDTRVETDVGVLRHDLPAARGTDDDGGPRFETRYWAVRIVPVLDGAGQVELLLQRVRDVTDTPAGLAAVLDATPGLAAGGSAGRDVAAAALSLAALATALRTELDQVREALASRAVIDQAKGVLMGQRRCTADEAFALLVALSQRSNRKLREVSAVLVADTAAAVDGGVVVPPVRAEGVGRA